MNLAQSLQNVVGKSLSLTVEKQSVLIKSQQGTFGKTAKMYKSIVRYGSLWSGLPINQPSLKRW